MLLDELFEARTAYLYHGTNGMSAARILEDDKLGAHTSHLRGNLSLHATKYGREERIVGVSTTRSRAFASRWGEVVFELDQVRLRQSYRLAPIDFYSDHPIKDPRYRREESEEFVISPVGIKPLSRYLTAIYINQATFDELGNDKPVVSRFATTRQVPTRDHYSALLKHPLLHIV